MSDNRNFVKSINDATLLTITHTAKKMGKACLIVEGAAKKGCPVNEGPLRASITSETKVSPSEITGTIGSNLEYAPYVHNGTGVYAKDGNGRKTPWGYSVKNGKHKGFYITRGQRPQPFLENAMLENRRAVERAFRD